MRAGEEQFAWFNSSLCAVILVVQEAIDVKTTSSTVSGVAIKQYLPIGTLRMNDLVNHL